MAVLNSRRHSIVRVRPSTVPSGCFLNLLRQCNAHDRIRPHPAGAARGLWESIPPAPRPQQRGSGKSSGSRRSRTRDDAPNLRDADRQRTGSGQAADRPDRQVQSCVPASCGGATTTGCGTPPRVHKRREGRGQQARQGGSGSGGGGGGSGSEIGSGNESGSEGGGGGGRGRADDEESAARQDCGGKEGKRRRPPRSRVNPGSQRRLVGEQR